MEQTQAFPVYFTDGLYYYKLIGSHESIEVRLDKNGASASIEYECRDIEAGSCVAYGYWENNNGTKVTTLDGKIGITGWIQIDEDAFLDVFRTAQGYVSKSITRESIAQSAPAESLEEMGEIFNPNTKKL